MLSAFFTIYLLNCFFLTPPQPISEAEIAQELKEMDLNMAWCKDNEDYFRFRTTHDDVYFELGFIKPLPECLEAYQDGLFERGEQFIYAYKWHEAEGEQINSPSELSVIQPNSDHYLIHERRVFEKSAPQTILEEELISIIADKAILFYTGAGISAASSVPTMGELEQLLHLENGMCCEFYLSALKDPKELALGLKFFHNSCFFSPPTKAHVALKGLALFKNTQIVTENLDFLHEYTGMMPIRVSPEYFRKEIDPSSWTEVDYIICIGLSFDDRGFLGWYKAHHPDGKIIAIDLGKPSYLGNEDFLLQGDLQEVVSRMAERF